MMDYTPATPPRALILCGDGRLSRLLENELAYLGVTARAAETLPPPDEALCLLVADGDGFPLPDCTRLASDCGCPLLVFGRETVTLPDDCGEFLRRPFVLTDLEDTLRRLLAPAAAGATLWGAVEAPAPRRAIPSPETRPLLTLENGTVLVAGKPLPMTPAEQAIFDCLYTHRGETVTKEALLSLLGGGGNSVEVYVCKLRAKLEKPLGRRMITTVRGVGYRMEECK